MTKGHRVARSSLKTSKAVRKLFPWAQVVVKVGSTRVAYESAEDASEEHGGAIRTAGHGKPMGGPLNFRDWPKRRGDLA